MYEVESDIPVPINERDKRLYLAKAIYANGGIGKSTAAKMAIEQLGIWPMVELQSAIDYLRNNIIEK